MVSDERQAQPLRVTSKQWNTIAGHVRQGAPLEVCGLLGGVGRRVHEVFPAENVAANPATGYEVDPQRLFDVLTRLDARGWDLVGIYHSHPPGSLPEPSPADVARAMYPDAVQLIVVPGSGGEIISRRGFLIDTRGGVSEVPVVVVPDAGGEGS